MTNQQKIANTLNTLFNADVQEQLAELLSQLEQNDVTCSIGSGDICMPSDVLLVANELEKMLTN
jgi:hypothetical protein